CLHTAGSDGRQYRAVLNDPEITKHYRVVAFDMPWHGKSSPPAGWEREEYRLTAEAYASLVMAVARGLGLARPVVMGCAVGARLRLPPPPAPAPAPRAPLWPRSAPLVLRDPDPARL